MNRIALQALLTSCAACLPLLCGPAFAQDVAEDMTQDVAETVAAPDAATPLDSLDDLPPPTEPEILPRRYTVPMSDATDGRAQRRLDWRSPQTSLRFDLLEAATLDTLSVTLSADPLPGADPSLPLLVRFNGNDPVEIPTNGAGFDTTLELDPTRARKTGNVLQLTHAVQCDAPSGGYRVDMAESRLDVTILPLPGRLADDPQTLGDVETRLASPVFAPATVGLVSAGPDQTKLQALAAQAVGLRMETVPEFRLSAGEADFDIVMVRRAQLFGYTEDTALLEGSGAVVALDPAQRDRLFLIGDTDAEVMEAARAFSTSVLPAFLGAIAPAADIQAQTPIDADHQDVSGRTTLDMLSVQTGTRRDFTFDVADPAASEGEIVLRLTRDGRTKPGTRLRAQLNGEVLGEARVRGRRMTVAYPVRSGLLTGNDNHLELTTIDADPSPRCGASDPFIAISEGSELRLEASVPTSDTDLSRFAADGSLFGAAGGANTVVVLPLGNLDFTTALSVVAKLARADGSVWTQADFERGDTVDRARHQLRIEPLSEIERHVRLAAPRGLQGAWRGQRLQSGPPDTAGQFASLDGEQTMVQAAHMVSANRMVQARGVAALYPSPDGRLIGVISNTADSLFADAVEPLLRDDHWNRLSGAVSQWNDTAVAMAQTALPFDVPVVGTPDAERPPSLTQQAKQAVASLSEVEWPRPDVASVGSWVDGHWIGFSEDLRARAGTVELAVDAAARLEAGERTRTGLSQASAQVGDLRTSLWRHLDIEDADRKAVGTGQAQTLPIALALCVMFLMVLIGMAFAGPLPTPHADDEFI